MSHRLGRVVSDLSHSSNSRSGTDRNLHNHQSTTSNNEGCGNVGKARQKLSLLFSGVVAWTRSESSCETGSKEKSSSSKQQPDEGGTGGRRRGLEIVLPVRKYVAMVEQLFTFYSGSSSSRDVMDRRRRVVRRQRGRPHTFTSGSHAGGNAAQTTSKRHRGRLSSAPASLRGSPATSGHLSVGESLMKASASLSSSEVSTMEELQSAIQAAIAHCKNSVAGGGDKQQQR